MNAIERLPGTFGWTRRARTVAVVTAVGLLLLLPAVAMLSASVQSPAARSPSGGSGLSAAWDRPVHFIESGLAPGTLWSVNLDGTLGSSTTSEINFTWISGTFPFTVTPVRGYTAQPSAGNVTVTCMATVYITFTPIVVVSTYTVWFNETGLASGMAWWADLNGSNVSATTSSISFTVPNGTYAFTTPGVLAGEAGVQFVTSVSNGTVVVDGANALVMVPYSTQYFLTMSSMPPGGGVVTPSSGWYPAGATVDLSATPNSGYAFIEWNGTGVGNYTGTSATPTVTMGSPIEETAVFGVAYAVDFQESGLADGVTWSVTFNGVTQSSFFVFLDFTAVNGSYPYTVAPIAGYHADSYQGIVNVNGANVTVVIHWVRVTYNATFEESGLPSGTTWSVDLNGTVNYASVSSINFVVPNGTYPWSVGPVSGYTANQTSGSVVVNGANVVVEISWTTSTQVVVSKTYTVTFVENGLPAATYWTVTLNGSGIGPMGSTTTVVQIVGVVNGVYQYWAPDAAGYHATVPTGTVTVAGSNVTVGLTFVKLTSTATSGTAMISALDLLIFGLIGGGVVTAVYLIHRRP